MELNRRTALGVGLGGLTAALTGCTDALRRPAAETAAPSTSPAAPSTSNALVIGAADSPAVRDPYRSWDTEVFRRSRQVCQTLLGIDPQTGAARPWLARTHEVSADGRQHTFVLHDGLRFSDGTACDADAVVANVRRWAEASTSSGGPEQIGSPFVTVFGAPADHRQCRFDSVEAHGRHTVRLHLTHRLRHLPAALTSPQFAILAPGCWEDDGAASTPIGTGPHRWATRSEAEKTLKQAGREPTEADDTDVFLLNEHHNDQTGQSPAARTVLVDALGRAPTRLRQLRRGTVDVIDVVTPDQLRPLVETGAQVLQRDPLSVLYLGMNLSHPVMRSLYVRQAVARGVDRPALARNPIFLDGTALAHDVVPPTLGVDPEAAERYDVHPGEAKRLLSRAGYEQEPLELMYPTGTGRPSMPQPEQIYAQVAEDLGKIGLHVVPVPVPPSQDYLRAVLERGSRAMHLMSRDGLYRDAHAFLEPLCRSSTAETHYDNPQTRRLLREAAGADDEDRRAAYARIVRSLSLDLPVLPLVYPISAVAIGERVGRYPSSPQLDEHWADIRLS